MDWIDVGNEIWIISQEYNVLLHVEKKTKITRAEAFIERYPLYKAEWYYSSVLSGDYIVCIPALAKDIAIYSLSRGKTYYIHITNSEMVYQYFKGYVYEGNVLIFGAAHPALINVNPEERKINYIDDWGTDAEKYISQRNSDFYFGDGYVRFESDLFIPMSYCGAFLDTELDTLQCRVMVPPDKMDSIESVTKIEDMLCFIGRKEALYYLCLWKPGNKKMKKLQIPYQDKNVEWISFLSPFFWKLRVYLVPRIADHFYVMDLKNEEIEIEQNLDVIISEFPEETQDIKVGAYKQNGNIVTFHTWWDYKWHRYNLDTWEHEEFELHLNNEDYTQYCQKALCDRLIDEKNIISEQTIPLPIFLNKIKNMEHSDSEREGAFRREEQKWKTFLKTGH